MSDIDDKLVSALKEQPIRFCAGIHEWPPYYYFVRENGVKTSVIAGFDIELFGEIFSKHDIREALIYSRIER